MIRSYYMNKKALFMIPAAIPRSGLLERVLLALYTEQQQSRLWRVRVFATTALLSLAALVPVVISLVKAFATSNFDTYLSLVFTDGSVLLSYWKTIGASLIEALPVLSLAVTLALVGALLWSLRCMVRFTNSPSITFGNAI